MDYKIKKFNINLGFEINENCILNATNELNKFLATLPPSLYRNIDYKTTGALIGAVYCTKLSAEIKDSMVNPIEKGYPDIIPISGSNASEEELRNYPYGLEVKGTIGNLKKGKKLYAGESRITALSGITWQAHHRDGKMLLGFVWDFVNFSRDFKYPAITAVYFTNQLDTDDWGQISGTTGRNTKVTGMKKSGKAKMAKGNILIIDNAYYIKKYSKLLEQQKNAQTKSIQPK